MRLLVSGSTGLVGSAILEAMRRQGHDVARLLRPSTQLRPRAGAAATEHNVAWNPSDSLLDPSAEGADVVVHLAGASIADGRWNPTRKQELRDSRVATTRQLVSALKALHRPPQVFVAASAIGFYGNRGDEELTESSSPGSDFLAQLCLDWESESARAAEFGARAVMLRSGVILARNGGALPKMALPFRFGAGGRVGSGRQWMSWIALEDVVGIIAHAISSPQMAGPVNVVAPHPTRNADFASTLGRAMRRPAILPTPSFVLRLALGEMADALLLSSQRVLPQKIEQSGYRFAQPELGPALASVLGNTK